MRKSDTKQTSTGSNRVYILVAVASYLIYAGLTAYRKRTDDPYSFIIPNAMLFLGYLCKPLTVFTWRQLAYWDKSKGRSEMTPIAEMDASEYSYEKLRELTEDFMKPAIVRGLFDGVPAQTLWPQPGYLSSIEPLNKMKVPVIKNSTYATWDYNEERPYLYFEEAYEEVLANEDLHIAVIKTDKLF